MLIGHSSEPEDWDLNNRFLQSFQFDQPAAAADSPTPIPTAVPIDPSYYQGFWTYTHPVYGFSIMLPEDWAVDETTTFDPLMNGHMLILHPRLARDIDLSIRMTFPQCWRRSAAVADGRRSGRVYLPGNVGCCWSTRPAYLFGLPNRADTLHLVSRWRG